VSKECPSGSGWRPETTGDFGVALSLEGKKAVVAEVAEVARSAHSAIAAEYRGLTVGDMTALRVKARASGVYVRVVRNTLARRALQDTDFECMNERLVGPLVLAFSKEEPGAAARLMRDFSKGNDKLVVKLVSFGGHLYEASDIDVLATLPTREEALAQLLGVLMAPASKLARTLNEAPSMLVRVLDAHRQKQAA
jgi:large subunit ribosomal protein L10